MKILKETTNTIFCAAATAQRLQKPRVLPPDRSLVLWLPELTRLSHAG